MDKMRPIPYGQIQWLVDKMHVGTSDEDVTKDLVARMDGWNDREKQAAIEFALKVHAHNRNLFHQVNTGNFNANDLH